MDIKRFCRDSKLVIVEFWSDECLPCLKINPFLQEIESAYSDKLNIVRINVTNNPSTAEYYNVTEIPTFIFLKNNELVGRINGFNGNIKFEKLLRNLI